MDVATTSKFLALLAIVAVGGSVAITALRLLPGPGPATVRADVARVAPWLAAAVAVAATAGSLYYSEIAGFVPCELCWYQRIAMYPLAVVLPIAAVRGDRTVGRYAVPLAVLGAAVSVYHVQLQAFPDQSSSCDAAAPCTVREVTALGFVTIPMMALAGFVTVVALFLAGRPTRTAVPATTSEVPVP
ncbi:MAG: disulfide bond formation protein B [Actinobacteria bacterium]|nr:disulfide bond formation protein B [Actinomycetota bacterium]